MTMHVCRDFLSTGNPLNLFFPYLSQYFSLIFMRVVLGYTVVGQTNCNIDSATLRIAVGAGGSLNQGASDPYAFQPVGYTVSALDIGRILVLKSPGHPLVNSGLFRITAIDLANNWFYIDYRSGDIPPAETGMTWGIYEHESAFQAIVNTTGNGITTEYTGRGAATQTRIIVQSPHSTAYQVRFCLENTFDTDSSFGPVGGIQTIAPGYGGNSAGDFQPGGQCLHSALFFNKRVQQLKGGAVGWVGNAPGGNTQSRVYMWGDDVTGTFLGVNRSVTVGGSDSWVVFGLPEDEEQPLPPKNVQRLFTMGQSSTGNGGANGIYWYCGTLNDGARMGVGFGLSNQPISCIFSIYVPMSNIFWGPGARPARNTLNAGDNPYLQATELLSVDLVVGTHDNLYLASNNEMYVLEGRRIGRTPFARMGRSNYGYFQIAPSLDGNTWLHTADGIYLPWKGAILP